MPLNPYSLRHLDPAYRDALDEAALRVWSVKRREDLKKAWDRLNQGPENRSRPPSRRAPWERKGTRTDVGSRIFALLASVVDIGRQRGHFPWRYLEQAIADRHAGRPLAPLPR